MRKWLISWRQNCDEQSVPVFDPALVSHIQLDVDAFQSSSVRSSVYDRLLYMYIFYVVAYDLYDYL